SLAFSCPVFRGLVSFPSSLSGIVALPALHAFPTRRSSDLVSDVIIRPPQLQAAMSTNMALSLVDVRPVKLIPVDAFAVVNVALEFGRETSELQSRSEAGCSIHLEKKK